ncbi:MAG: endolytic transglycosylase MltG, partial [Candidatus Poribacteria bacterium]|nr:endolytic transglycosylase MltG [Candidatus Poribacteria bacterium]
PYNTYLHKGLPPGPICNPGRASIMAALRPAKTPYFYFVASGGGGHYFSETLDQHQRMVRRYQKSRRSQQIAKTPDSDDY